MHTDPSLAPLHLSREARIVAFLALKTVGRAKLSTLELAVDVKRAVLADCDIDQERGLVHWVAGPVPLTSAGQVRFLRRAVDQLLDDDQGEGVDIELAEGALELHDALARALDPAAAPTEAASASAGAGPTPPSPNGAAPGAAADNAAPASADTPVSARS